MAIPAVILTISADELLGLEGAALEDVLSAAASAGLTAVVLRDARAGGGADLYTAACRARDVLRGRAALLLADRTDICSAAGADGVVLSSAGASPAFRSRVASHRSHAVHLGTLAGCEV